MLVTEHLAALRIDAGHDVLDGAVFARRVHALQDDEHGAFVFGVQKFVQGLQLFDMAGEPGFGVFFRDAEGFVRIALLQMKFEAGRDDQLMRVPFRYRCFSRSLMERKRFSQISLSFASSSGRVSASKIRG